MNTPVHLSPRHHEVCRTLWIWAAACVMMVAMWVLASGVRIVWANDIWPVLALVICAFIGWFYRYVRRDDHICLLGHATAQLLLITATGAMLSYLTARLNIPLVDEQLIALDRMFFFDWRDYIAWVDTHPTLAALFTVAYRATGAQIIVLAVLLFLYKQAAHIQRFIFAYTISALTIIFLAMLFPAVGGYVHYDIDVMTAYQHVHPETARIHEEPLLSMRAQAGELILPMYGLITFPSFHSALAILLTYACWPLRRLRWFVLPLNVITLFSTPVDGGHYLTDVLAGVGIALIGIALARRLMREMTPRPEAPR